MLQSSGQLTLIGLKMKIHKADVTWTPKPSFPSNKFGVWVTS